MQKRHIIFQHFSHSCPLSQLDFLLIQNALDKGEMLDYEWDPSLHRQGDGGDPKEVSEPQRQSQLPPDCLWRESGRAWEVVVGAIGTR